MGQTPLPKLIVPNHALTLKAILKARKQSASDYGAAAGLSRADISNIFSGRRIIGRYLFGKLASALNENDAARFAEAYFRDLLPEKFPGKVSVAPGSSKRQKEDVRDMTWAIEVLTAASEVNENLRNVLMNLAVLHK